MSAEPDDTTALRLRERLEAADSEIDVPAGLWERVSAAGGDARPRAFAGRDAGSVPAPAGVLRWRWRTHPLAVVALAAVAVVAVVTGGWWLQRPAAPADHGPAAGPVTLTVHNAERACRELRTMECALRVAEDPYARYAAPGNRAAVVWHDARLTASCVVTDGTLVTDESGVSSTRWYKVRTPDGADGWLPGVRTRNGQDLRTCSADERPDSPHAP